MFPAFPVYAHANGKGSSAIARIGRRIGHGQKSGLCIGFRQQSAPFSAVFGLMRNVCSIGFAKDQVMSLSAFGSSARPFSDLYTIPIFDHDLYTMAVFVHEL